MYDIIDNDADLHSVYGIVFYYLQIDELVSRSIEIHVHEHLALTKTRPVVFIDFIM